MLGSLLLSKTSICRWMRWRRRGAITSSAIRVESGAKAHRPEWDNCLDHLRKGDMLVIWKLDRASRLTKHLIELAEDLKKRGVKLRSLKAQIDTSSAMGKFFFRMAARARGCKESMVALTSSSYSAIYSIQRSALGYQPASVHADHCRRDERSGNGLSLLSQELPLVLQHSLLY